MKDVLRCPAWAFAALWQTQVATSFVVAAAQQQRPSWAADRVMRALQAVLAA
jgi:hypothetical protein